MIGMRGVRAAVLGVLLAARTAEAQAPVPLQAKAQPRARLGAISGRVVDSLSGLPLRGLTVTIESVGRNTRTSIDGRFFFDSVAAGPARLVVTRTGTTFSFSTVMVTAGEVAGARILTKVGRGADRRMVLTGYGAQPADASSGAITTISAGDANVGVIASPTQLLVARAPGVNVTLNNGEPGANAQVRIRGTTSILGDNEPLYVIDGMPMQNIESEARGIGIGGTPALGRNPLNAINPSDIASITVLRDAASTAVFGSRGANGVVLIETTRGRRSGVAMTYETYAALGQAAKSLGFLTGDQYRAFVQSQVSSGRLPASRLAALGTASTNWEDATQRSSLSQHHNFTISGGSPRSAFRASVNYADLQGAAISSGMQRLQARLNAEHEALNGRLRIGLNASTARIDNDYLPFENTGGFEGGVFQNVAIFNPTRPIYVRDPLAGGQTFYEEGTGRQGIRNPVALARQVLDDGQTNRTIANLTTSYALTPTVVAQVNVGTDYTSGQRNGYLPRASPVGAEFSGFAQRAKRTLSNRTLLGTLRWAPDIRRAVEFDLLTGIEYTGFRNTDELEEARGFASDAAGYGNLGAGAIRPPVQSSLLENNLASLFTRVNFGFRKKYFLTGVLRRDARSQFGQDQGAVMTPAISAAWRMTEESFAQALPFSELKLRVGYARQCNGAASRVAADTAVIVIGPGQNPERKCERSEQSNVALDFGVLGSRLTGSVDVYRERVTGLLLNVPVSRNGGSFLDTQLQSVGAMSNKGLELSLDAQLFERPGSGLQLSTGVIVSVERNKVLSVGPTADFLTTTAVSGPGQSGVLAQRIIPGQPLGTFYGAAFAGFNATGDQTFTRYTVTRDANGNETSRVANGVTTTPSFFDDSRTIGNANPTFSLGLRSSASWRRFDASWLWRAEQGRDVFNNTALIHSAKSNVQQNRNFLASGLGTPGTIDEPSIYSSRWIEDGSFVRLQNVTLGYSFVLPGAGRSARVYVSGDNLLLFAPYSGYDPELFVDAGFASRGVDYLSYPRARAIAAGFRVQF